VRYSNSAWKLFRAPATLDSGTKIDLPTEYVELEVFATSGSGNDTWFPPFHVLKDMASSQPTYYTVGRGTGSADTYLGVCVSSSGTKLHVYTAKSGGNIYSVYSNIL